LNPLEKLRKVSGKPLGVHSVQTPELSHQVEFEADATDEQKAVLLEQLETQYIAELSGSEMDSFVSLWASIRDDDEEVLSYRRAAIAYCWSDKDRTLYNVTKDSIESVMGQLKRFPSTLTTRMFTVANGANAFAGIDDETKKNSKVGASVPKPKTKKPKSEYGNGEQLSV
jgi:hypothetical protein